MTEAKIQTPETSRALLLASYCGDEPDCNDNSPCLDCIEMCNVIEVPRESIKVIRQFDQMPGHNALNRQSELEAEVKVLREARLRLFGILGGAESITFDQDRFGYTQDEFGWRHSLDILEDGVEMYDRAEKDVELLNLLSTMPDDIANALTKADGGDDDGK